MPNKINSQGRQCSACKVFKGWSNYGKHKKGTRGKSIYCKECNTLIKKRAYDRRKASSINLNNDIDLSPLLTMATRKKNSWRLEEAIKLFDGCIKALREDRASEIKSDEFVALHCSGRKKSVCLALIAELTRAAKKGYKIKHYWAEGRPLSLYSYKKKSLDKVLVAGSK